MIVQLKEIVMGNTAEWCLQPYPDHKKGCPNYGKREGCPPLAPLATDLIRDPYYLVYQKFDLAAQEKRLLEKHPNWSKRQARCCLYWQRGFVKGLLIEAWEFLIQKVYETNECYECVENPEGAGIDLFKTCEQAGIHLERDYLHQQFVYKMVIVARRK